MQVSVVIPCYNGATFVAEAVASARAQTRPPAEIVVIDDGSTDDSARIAGAAGARVIATGANVGPATARNRGIYLARGELVAFLDADDLWQPDHLDGLAGLLERHPTALAAFSGARITGGPAPGVRMPSLVAERPIELFWQLPTENPIIQSGCVVRREALLDVGGYRDGRRFAEDFDLWMRLARRGPFVFRPVASITYRLHAAQWSRDSAQLYAGKWESLRDMLAQLSASGPEADVHRFEAVLAQAWEADLRESWHERMQAPFRIVHSMGRSITGVEDVSRRWRWRARLRPAWRAGAAIWDLLPDQVRARFRRRRVTGGSLPQA